MAAEKYLVIKLVNDTSIENSFILHPGKDPAAVKALQAYAAATDNKVLANDLYAWVGKPTEQQTLEQVIRERDQLMEDLEISENERSSCMFCRYKPFLSQECYGCTNDNNHWVWRGMTDQKGSDQA